MIVFVDNDAILKLAAWDLLDLLVEILRVEKQALRVLPTLKYQLNSTKWIEKYGIEACQKVRAFIADLPELEENAALADSLPKCKGIDTGEKLLLAATTNTEVFFLTTGDKNFLRALPNAAGYGALVGNLERRVVCLEQILWLGTRSRSHALIQEGVKKNPECDKATQAIFGSRLDAPLVQVEEGFQSYVNSLRSDTGDLLHIFEELENL